VVVVIVIPDLSFAILFSFDNFILQHWTRKQAALNTTEMELEFQ
jgi:hypothetical protein